MSNHACFQSQGATGASKGIVLKPKHRLALMQHLPVNSCWNVVDICWLPAFEVRPACGFLVHVPIGLKLTFVEASGGLSSVFSHPWIRPRETPGLRSPHSTSPLERHGCLAACNCFLLEHQWLKACQSINILYYLQTCMLGQGKHSATESPPSELFSLALKFHFMFSWYLQPLLCLFSLLCASD